MSRIGNTPIKVPTEVTVAVDGKSIAVKGPKGELTHRIPHGITVRVDNGEVKVESKRTDKPTRALHGFIRALLANDIVGVTNGWSKTLELSGVGYRATMNANDLVLTIGFSHPVTVRPPKGIVFSIVDGKMIIAGINKHLVGQVTANIRAIKKPEPYKGKGIMYSGEHIRKKAGKAAKAIGGAPGTGGAK